MRPSSPLQFSWALRISTATAQKGVFTPFSLCPPRPASIGPSHRTTGCIKETSDSQSRPSNLKKRNYKNSLFFSKSPHVYSSTIVHKQSPRHHRGKMPVSLRGPRISESKQEFDVCFGFRLFPSMRFRSLRRAFKQVFRCKDLQELKLHALAYPT